MNFSTSAALAQGQTPEIDTPPPQKTARWRHFLALLVIGSYPIFSALSVALRGGNDTQSNVSFPTTVDGLLLFSALQMAIFGIFWGIAWAISRYDKRTLFLEWHSGFAPIVQGFFYSIALRVGVLLVASLSVIAFLALGWSEGQIADFFREFAPDTRGIVESISKNDDPIYQFLVVTLLPFVVAGLREELWRGATFAGMLALCPQSWSAPMRNVFVVAISSIVFGLGHIYQGPTGVFMTTILGAGLGAMVLYHRSIWPAVIAHGFFNAVSFWAATRVNVP